MASTRRSLAVTLDIGDDLGAIDASEWDALAQRTRNVFATREVLTTWWKHFGAGRRLVLASARDESGALRALVPLYLWRDRPLRALRFVGHRVADELGPIAAPEDLDFGAGALRRAVEQTRAHVLLGEQAPVGWAERLGARVLAREGNPVLALDHPDWDAYLATRSSNFRQRVRRMERRLTGERGASFRLADDPARLGADLETLFELHRLRWGVDTAFYRRRAYHRELAPLLLERGRLRLWLLETRDDPVAACYCFRFAGVDSFYQGGRNPEWERDSVGLVILAHAVRDALAAGQDEFRFLRGGEPYKYKFTDDDPGLETFGLATGALGSAALTAASTARAARNRLRALRS